MAVIGLLSWFDEQPSMLGPCVSGFAPILDHLVAVDGAYAAYPDGRERSHPDQAETILRTCEAHNVGCVIHRPNTLWWGNEVAKRQMTLDLAAPLCSPGDWLCVIDSDYLVTRLEPERVLHDLASTDRHAATYTLLDGKDWLDGSVSDDKTVRGMPLPQFAQHHDIDTEWTFRSRALYRWAPDMRYGPVHWAISGTYDGERQWVYGPDLVAGHQDKVLPAHDLNDALVVYHRRQERTKLRRDRAAEYYRVKDLAELEPREFDWVLT